MKESLARGLGVRRDLPIALILVSAVVLMAAVSSASAYSIPTVISGSLKNNTWIAGRNLIALSDNHGWDDCGTVSGCGTDSHQRIDITDLFTGGRSSHVFGCPQMPADWLPHYAGIDDVTTSGDGKVLFAVLEMSNHQAQIRENPSANSDPLCSEIVQWTQSEAPHLIETDYPGAPPGSKTVSGHQFLIRSDDRGATWHLVPTPASLNLEPTLDPGNDTVLIGRAGKGITDFVAYPTPNGIAFGSPASGVAIYDPTTRTWGGVEPLSRTKLLAEAFFALPLDSDETLPSSNALTRKRKLSFDNWRFNSSGQISTWGYPSNEASTAKNHLYWLSADAQRVVKHRVLSAPKKRFRLQNYSGSLVSECAPRKLTARANGYVDAFASDSGKVIWAFTSPYVSVKCTTRNRNLWPKGRLLTDGISSQFVRSTNGGRSWKPIKKGKAFRSSYTFATAIENSLIVATGKCRKPDGTSGKRIHRLTGKRWKSYGCI